MTKKTLTGTLRIPVPKSENSRWHVPDHIRLQNEKERNILAEGMIIEEAIQVLIYRELILRWHYKKYHKETVKREQKSANDYYQKAAQALELNKENPRYNDTKSLLECVKNAYNERTRIVLESLEELARQKKK